MNTILNIRWLFFLSALTCWSAHSQLAKKAEKEVIATFNIQHFLTESIDIPEEISKESSAKINRDNFFRIKENGTLVGYVFLGVAPSRDNVFDYLVIFDNQLAIINIKILAYRENYGGEIASKRWLKQFIGKKVSDTIKYERDIDAISGATVSANSLTVSINNLLKSVSLLVNKKIL